MSQMKIAGKGLPQATIFCVPLFPNNNIHGRFLLEIYHEYYCLEIIWQQNGIHKWQQIARDFYVNRRSEKLDKWR